MAMRSSACPRRGPPRGAGATVADGDIGIRVHVMAVITVVTCYKVVITTVKVVIVIAISVFTFM